MFSDDELVPISALQHLVFCERQWALIHLEQVWFENILTTQGKILHERVDDAEREVRGDVVIVRSLQIRSLQLGLIGKADVVEFHETKDRRDAIRFKDQPGWWIPFPVEYKRGKPKIDDSDKVQLCAQALCLEEMLSINVHEGALFYGTPHRRSIVQFDQGLRSITKQYIDKLHEMTEAQMTPPASYRKRCTNCSLQDYCLPKTTDGQNSAQAYIDSLLADLGRKRDDSV